MDIQKEHKSREAFESLWIQSNGHFKYFVFSQEHGKYIPTGVRDNLTDQELLFVSITLNTAYLFFIGGIKTQAIPEGFVLVPKEPTRGLYRSFYDAFNSANAGNTAQCFKVAYKAMIEAAEESQ